MIAEMILQHAVAYRGTLGIHSLSRFLVGPLTLAVFFNRLPIVQHFLNEYGADPTCANGDGETILSLATYRNKFHMVKYILGLPGVGQETVNNKNFLGNTALHTAAGGSNPRILKMLLSHGASFASVGFMNHNVLHTSANMANKRAFCHLFDHIEKASPATLREMMQQKDQTGGNQHYYHRVLVLTHSRPFG